MATPTQEHISEGVERYFLVPTIASASLIPTAAEVNAGVELTTLSGGLINAEGLVFENQQAEVRGIKSNFVGKCSGENVVQNITLRFNRAGHALDDVKRTALAIGTEAHLVRFYEGTSGATPAAGDRCEVWKGRSTGPSRDVATGNENAKWHTGFATPTQPNLDATLT
jgi:hypothetical protein